MKKFEARDKTIRDIFTTDFYYVIPKFQRSYAWSKDNAQEMWDDIMSDGDLFLGSFVFNVASINEGYVEIVDGQQRITTINILLSVLRNKLKSIEEKDKAILIQNKLSFVSDIYDTNRPRLKPNNIINNFFEKTIQNYEWSGNFPKKIEKEHRQVKEVYDFFKEKLDELINESNKINKENIINIIKEVQKKIYTANIIWIEVANDEDAYFIFETMNARGEDLTVADLLKNYFFSKITNKKDESLVNVEEEWGLISENVKNVPRITTSKYLRYHWLSKYSFVTEKNLYRKIKRSNINPEKLLKELVHSSSWLSLLGSGDKNEWEVAIKEFKLKPSEIYNSIEALRVFGTTQCYVLFICLLTNIKHINFNFSYIFKKIENFHFIYSVISKQPGNKVEKLYSKTSKEINLVLEKEKQDAKITKEVKRILDNLINELKMPPFETFHEKFLEVGYKDKILVRYIFDRYNKYLSHKFSSSIDILNNTEYTVEHILPQDPKDWNLNKKEVYSYVNILGNLIIVDKKINGWMQNDPFESKLKKLKESNLPLIKDFISKYKNSNWNSNTIKERHKYLSELAYNKIWN